MIDVTIYLYSGTPGSGKSLHAARDIRDYLRCKRLPVIGNFAINPDTKGYDRYTYRPNDVLTPQYLVWFAQEYWADHKFGEDRILLVLDECQLLFNSRDWAQQDRMAWLEFFSQHRKYGYKVLFIAQFDRMIDRQIRSLIEYEYIHRKLGNFGAKGKIMTLLALGEVFVCVKRFYSLNERIGVEMFRARKSVYRLYDSYATFDRTGGGDEGAGRSGDPAPIADARPDGGRAGAHARDTGPPAIGIASAKVGLRRLARSVTGGAGAHVR